MLLKKGKDIMLVTTTWLNYKQYIPSQNNVNNEYCLPKSHVCVQDVCYVCGRGGEVETES